MKLIKSTSFQKLSIYIYCALIAYCWGTNAGEKGQKRMGTLNCASFLAPQVFQFDSIMPDVGRGIIELFPGSLMSRNTALLHFLRTETSETPPSNLVMFPGKTPRLDGSYHDLQDMVDKLTGSVGRRHLLFGPTLSVGPSSFEGFGRLLDQAKLEQPRLNLVDVRVSDIKDFWRDSPIESYKPMLIPENPITILPREWQIKILQRLLRKPLEILPPEYIEQMLVKAENTSFSLDGSAPRQPLPPPKPRTLEDHYGTFFLGGSLGRTVEDASSTSKSYSGNLNPGDPRLGFLLSRMIKYYFGNRRTLDERDLLDVYRRHISFSVRNRNNPNF